MFAVEHRAYRQTREKELGDGEGRAVFGEMGQGNNRRGNGAVENGAGRADRLGAKPEVWGLRQGRMMGVGDRGLGTDFVSPLQGLFYLRCSLTQGCAALHPGLNYAAPLGLKIVGAGAVRNCLRNVRGGAELELRFAGGLPFGGGKVAHCGDMSWSDESVVVAPVTRGELFRTFFRLGCIAFGGPAAVVPMRELVVKKRRWMVDETFGHGLALCQALPGITSIQTAAFVGMRLGGPAGAVAAFVGYGLPAFILMMTLASLYARGHDLGPMLAAFRGLQAIVLALLLHAIWVLGQSSIRTWREMMLAGASAGALVATGSPILAIIAAGVGGMLLRPARREVDGLAGAEPDRPEMPWVVPILAATLLAGWGVLRLTQPHLATLGAIFAKVDIVAFGGGFTSLPLMFDEIVTKRHMLSPHVFMDGIALGQVTPGPFAITATYAGYQIAGFAGGVVATIAMFGPSLMVLIIAARHMQQLRNADWFPAMSFGAKCSFVCLLGSMTIHFGRAMAWDWRVAALGMAAYVARCFSVDTLWVVLAGVGISVLVF